MLKWSISLVYIVAGTSAAHGQCGYTIEFITESCGDGIWATFDEEAAINDLGQVAGNAGCVATINAGFVWDGSGSIEFVDLPQPATSALIRDLNDALDVTGSTFIPNVGSVASSQR